MRPEEGSEILGNWKDPYTRAMMITNDVRMADKIVWYAYRFPKYFLKSLDYSEDILHEILIEVSKVPYFELFPHDISRISRTVVAKFLAKVGMTLSGYTNFKSWINRKMKLAIKNETNTEVVTELEEAVREIERKWKEGSRMNHPAMIVADKYPLVAKYAESGLSMKVFCLKHNITKYRLCQEIEKARTEYISFVYMESYFFT